MNVQFAQFKQGVGIVLVVVVALVLLMPLAASPVEAAAADLFISEYIEGSSNHKAIEIYNGTGAAVNLATGNYDIFMSFNGGTSTLPIALTGTVADGDVYVLAHSSADPTILAQADQTNNAGWFNGDDAVVLRKNGVVLDAIGQVGFDPGTEWGSGLTSTQDNTLRRKATVCAGDPIANDVFDPSFEWDGFATNTFDGLGAHAANCGGSSAEVLINEVDADTPGSDVAEFIELFDGGVGNTALDSLVLVLFNGSNDLSYQAFGLEGQSTDTDGYFVLCGNAANVANCDLDVIPDGDLIQNGADAVALFQASAADFPTGTAVTTSNLLDALVYDTNDADDAGLLALLNAGQPQVNEGSSDSASQSNQRCPNGTGEGRNTETYAQFAPTPGAFNDCEPGAQLVFIHEVQGSGSGSGMVGELVIIEGVVVGDYQDGAAGANGDLNGFFVQEEDADVDADATTSEGIFVFDGSSPAVNVTVGDVVQVTGTVAEFSDLTELSGVTAVQVISSGNSVTPAQVDFPVNAVEDLEAFEGMAVQFVDALFVTEFFNLDRFGEMVLAEGGRFTQFTQVNAPDVPGYAAYLADIARRRITLDDGFSTQNTYPIVHMPGAPNTTIRGGDSVASLTGVMHYAFGLYRVQPVGPVSFTSNNLRPAGAPEVGGNITVASFNVLNFFNGDGLGGGFPTSRGASTLSEYTRQLNKLVAALAELDADVVGLIEIENDGFGPTSAIAQLVDALNAVVGAGIYTFVDPGVAPVGTDEIMVAFIYKTTTVSPVGAAAILDSSIDPNFIDTKNRPALAQTFTDLDTGGVFTVVVNHLKSKGTDCNDVGDPDLGDGQGNCNITRALAAQALVDWLATDPTGSGDPDVLIIGDLNSYAQEDPIQAILNAGYTDLAQQFVGSSAYSYVFDGQWGTLDYGLANALLTVQVTGAAEWHINADEPDAIDYDETFNNPALYAPDEFRASDHDPVVIGLALTPSGSIGDLVWDDLDVDGIQDGAEPGLADVTVNLYDESAALLATTTTGTDGLYLFDRLGPGSYLVEVEPPPGHVFTLQDRGSDDTLDSDMDLFSGQTALITLSLSQVDSTRDAGLLLPTIERLQVLLGRLCDEGQIDNHGICISLRVKLIAARVARDQGYTGVAVNLLQAFRHQVNAQAGRHITPDAAAILLLYSGYAIDLLEQPVLVAAPAWQNLVQNGDFSQGLAFWQESFRNGRLRLWQEMPYTAPANAPFEVLLDIGNATRRAQTVTVTLNDVQCVFTLPGRTPLQGSYAVRGLSATDWAGITLEIDGVPGVVVDNVSAQYVPGAFSVAQCGSVE